MLLLKKTLSNRMFRQGFCFLQITDLYMIKSFVSFFSPQETRHYLILIDNLVM